MNARMSSLSRSVALSSAGSGRLPFGGGAGAGAAQHLRAAAAAAAAAAAVRKESSGGLGVRLQHLCDPSGAQLLLGWELGRAKLGSPPGRRLGSLAAGWRPFRPPIRPDSPLVRAHRPAARVASYARFHRSPPAQRCNQNQNRGVHDGSGQ